MSKQLLLRVSVLAAATMLLLSGCFFFIGLDGWDLSNWTADLQIVGEWDSEFGNLDLYLSYPYPIGDNTTNDTGVPLFSDPYEDRLEYGSTDGDLGFFLEDDVAYRELVYSGAKKSTFIADSAASVEMTVDDTEEGEEVIIVRRPPFDWTINLWQYDETHVALPDSRDEYAWIGVSELYVNAAGGNIAAADLKVTVYDSNENPYISFRPPENANYSSASIARIHYFRARDTGSSDSDPYYLIVPDQRWISEGSDGFRSVTGTTANGETFVGIFGRPDTE